jgi:enoyl-CoA hydratase/carnithine racemase
VERILLDRGNKKNALTVAMYARLAGLLDEAAKDDGISVVILGSTNDAFSAGNDLLDFASNPPTTEDSAVIRFLKALAFFPKPVVAAVDGVAVGIGTTMLLHCDLVVATTRARFQLPFVKLALVPEAAASLLLPNLVGLQRASEWLLLGEPFDAEAALRAGIVNAVVDPSELAATAMAKAEALCRLPQDAVQASKRLIRAPQRAAIEAAMSSEIEVFAKQLQSPSAIAAFQAFLSKKK